MQKIFLVEDSKQVRKRLVQLLAALPDTRLVGEAADASTAISAIPAASPDIVLLDLQLQTGSGFDVLKALHPREPGIAFYMLSNFASEPYRRAAARLGAKDFFDKATEIERLRTALMGEKTCQPSSH